MERKHTESALDALRLIKLATSIDPYSLPANPRGSRPIIRAAWEKAGLQPSLAFATPEKLWQGMSDTRAIVHNALDDHKTPIAQDDALVIVRHATSIDTIAHAAQLRERSLRDTNLRQQAYNSYIAGGGRHVGYYSDIDRNPVYARRFVIDEQLGAIIKNPDFDESWEDRYPEIGCPFAHANPERPKIFDVFVSWAGTLAVRDYYETKNEE